MSPTPITITRSELPKSFPTIKDTTFVFFTHQLVRKFELNGKSVFVPLDVNNYRYVAHVIYGHNKEVGLSMIGIFDYIENSFIFKEDTLMNRMKFKNEINTFITIKQIFGSMELSTNQTRVSVHIENNKAYIEITYM